MVSHPQTLIWKISFLWVDIRRSEESQRLQVHETQVFEGPQVPWKRTQWIQWLQVAVCGFVRLAWSRDELWWTIENSGHFVFCNLKIRFLVLSDQILHSEEFSCQIRRWWTFLASWMNVAAFGLPYHPISVNTLYGFLSCDLYIWICQVRRSQEVGQPGEKMWSVQYDLLTMSLWIWSRRTDQMLTIDDPMIGILRGQILHKHRNYMSYRQSAPSHTQPLPSLIHSTMPRATTARVGFIFQFRACFGIAWPLSCPGVSRSRAWRTSMPSWKKNKWWRRFSLCRQTPVV